MLSITDKFSAAVFCVSKHNRRKANSNCNSFINENEINRSVSDRVDNVLKYIYRNFVLYKVLFVLYNDTDSLRMFRV